mmetsp:Transcript_48119/g.86576  ORF Transcript_48119/g.86576 Transcript_48119/m.86576 type:complete len:98 (+) Transcript_48119:32-325(+)
MAKQHCATFCMIMSAWAVPLLCFLGVLCAQGSRMIELPGDQKSSAAWGCFGSAVLYGLTFLAAYQYKEKLRREAPLRPDFSQELSPVSGRERHAHSS